MHNRTVLVCGGRDYADAEHVKDVLDTLNITYLITGDAQGADTLAANWAHINSVPYTRYRADWHTHGKAAGPIRNQEMLNEHPLIKLVVAFPGGKGTADMIRRAEAKGITVLKVPPSEE